MNDDKLLELKEKYKNRNLMEELSWGAYYNHQGYTYKLQAEFLNWLCYTAYKRIKELERPQGKWENICTLPVIRKCSLCGVEQCGEQTIYDNFCPNCGADMRGNKNG